LVLLNQSPNEWLQNLKTAEELEEEDRAAQSAKLQELIRRGTPRDLAAAQELMKSLAGANPDAKPDYRSQALTELNKLESKVVLLNEMLDNVDVQRGERFASGDAYDQVASILTTARPKLQKWISDAETDDPESLDTFLQINDQINTVLSRYEAFKKGDYSFAANPIPQELSNNGASSSTAGVSLIDFDDTAPSTSSGPVANDLSGLFSMQQPAQQPQQQQAFGLGPGFNNTIAFQQQPQQQQVTPHAPTPQTLYNNTFPRPTSMSPPHSQSATPPASIILPGTPQPTPPQMPNNFFGNGGAPMNHGMGMGMSMNPAMSANMGMGVAQPYNGSMLGGHPQQQQTLPMGYQQKQSSLSRPMQPSTTPVVSPPAQQPASTTSQQSKDPFADLAGLF